MKTLLTIVLSGIFGFGVSQATLVVDVRKAENEIAHLKDFEKKNTLEHKEIKEMFEKFLVQNQEFIAVIKLQNEMLLRK